MSSLTDVAHDGMTCLTNVVHFRHSGSDCAARRLQDLARKVAGAAPPPAGWAGTAIGPAVLLEASATRRARCDHVALVRPRTFVHTSQAVARSAVLHEPRRRHTPSNKGMKLTSVERIARSQLIPSVRPTEACV